MLGEATLHVSRTFAGERNTASHSVCRPAKALPWGLWHPILMQFYSGPLMHLLSGVDTNGRVRAHVIFGERVWLLARRGRAPLLDVIGPQIVPFAGERARRCRCRNRRPR